jgi:cytochrome c oxidase subunit 3
LTGQGANLTANPHADPRIRHAGHGDEHLAHHFETHEQQYVAGKLGMWLFLATEVLLFGGLFCAYAVYRANHPEIFVYAHEYLDKVLGGVNTVILICSSLTMAWAVRCAQVGQRRGLILCLVLTLVFACGFLCIKYVEYTHKWKEGLLWGTRFDPEHPPGGHGHAEAAKTAESQAVPESPPAPANKTATDLAPPVAAAAQDPLRGPAGLAIQPWEQPREVPKIKPRPSNVHIFFGIYFTMTGLHGLHVLAGMTVIFWILLRSIKGHFGPRYFTPVDFAGLYWHLVDLIWIYLFPLLYLIG